MLLRDIIERVENKKSDYQRYNFTQIENNVLMTFFDLAQEFETIEDFYNLCVAIPKVLTRASLRFVSKRAT